MGLVSKWNKERLEGMWRKGENYIFIHLVSFDGDEKFQPFHMVQVTMSTPRGWVPFGELDPEDGSIGQVHMYTPEDSGMRVYVEDMGNLSEWEKVEEFKLEI